MDNELTKRAHFYFQNKTIVHIETNQRRFHNGLIVEISKDHLILLDKFAGEIILFFSEILILDKYKPKEEEDG